MKSAVWYVSALPVGSLPSWECGLKLVYLFRVLRCNFVTPFVGVWIEIGHASGRIVRLLVTPFVGVWIEIFSGEPAEINHWMSLPSWECGLKFWLRKLNKMEAVVTPFVGVWIEIQICISV